MLYHIILYHMGMYIRVNGTSDITGDAVSRGKGFTVFFHYLYYIFKERTQRAICTSCVNHNAVIKLRDLFLGVPVRACMRNCAFQKI